MKKKLDMKEFEDLLSTLAQAKKERLCQKKGDNEYWIYRPGGVTTKITFPPEIEVDFSPIVSGG